ncbi:unnamed protein product [Anisakis simplex]|uniref:Neur_chan_LBD domain-containing protein n=1 Tax=Anisakis simplex TaxID=6269 RepID=A0A0M3KGJ8_ANISI|nr:unnamed protein product [Anisakis simplex]
MVRRLRSVLSINTLVDKTRTEFAHNAGIICWIKGNFQDYDMDVWLRMAWRDPRLAHGFDRPIMINEETFLKLVTIRFHHFYWTDLTELNVLEFLSFRKLWRPDPFFANAKKASFHRVTYLNFYMLIFPQGEIFFETRYVTM